MTIIRVRLKIISVSSFPILNYWIFSNFIVYIYIFFLHTNMYSMYYFMQTYQKQYALCWFLSFLKATIECVLRLENWEILGRSKTMYVLIYEKQFVTGYNLTCTSPPFENSSTYILLFMFIQKRKTCSTHVLKGEDHLYVKRERHLL